MVPGAKQQCTAATPASQGISADFRTLARTAYQRLFEVELFRRQKEATLGTKLSAAALARLYSEKVQWSPGNEPFSDSWIDEALTAFTRALCNDRVRNVIAWCDEAFGHSSPFNSVYKMSAVIKRAGTPEKIEWVYLGITDAIRAGLLNCDDFSVRSLVGQGGTRGLVDLFTMKHGLLKHLLHTTVQSLKFPTSVKAALVDRLGSHESYRKFVAPYPVIGCGAVEIVDLSWKSGWRNSADQMLSFVEAGASGCLPRRGQRAPRGSLAFDDSERSHNVQRVARVLPGSRFCWQAVVYGVAHDVSLKVGIKNRKAPADVLDYQPLKEILDEIVLELDKEEAANPAAAVGTADAAADDNGAVVDLDDCVDGTGRSAGIPGGGGGATGAVVLLQQPSVHPALRGLSPEQRAHWQAQALRMVTSHVKLIVEPAKGSELVEAVRDSTPGKLCGVSKVDCVLVLYDPKQSGEAITQPHLRCAPLREDHLAKHLGSVLEARRSLQPTAETLIEGDVVCLLDGGRHGAALSLVVSACVSRQR